MGPWATWAGGGHLAWGKGWGWMGFKILSNLSHSTSFPLSQVKAHSTGGKWTSGVRCFISACYHYINWNAPLIFFLYLSSRTPSELHLPSKWPLRTIFICRLWINYKPHLNPFSNHLNNGAVLIHFSLFSSVLSIVNLFNSLKLQIATRKFYLDHLGAYFDYWGKKKRKNCIGAAKLFRRSVPMRFPNFLVQVQFPVLFHIFT